MTPAAVTASDVVVMTIVIAVTAFFAYGVYRAMERPRLRLTSTADGPRASVRDTVQYAITAPLLVFTWYLFFSLILLFADNNLTAFDLVVLPAAIVLATRLLAHVNGNVAHELGKAVPLTLLTLLIISGGFRDDASLEQLGTELAGIDLSGPSYALLLVADYVFTAAWYWGWVRGYMPLSRPWRERRAAGSAQQVSDDDGGVAVLADTDGADRGA